MHTHCVGKEEVTQFAKDLASRFTTPPNSFPTVWCTLGPSGVKIARFYLKTFPSELQSKVKKMIAIDYNSRTGISFKDREDKKYLKIKNHVLLIDGSIHSGNSMLAAAKKLQELGAKNLTTYTLILKRGSVFIPNFFGIIIPDHDRAFFLLEKEGIPNNRIMPIGIMRKLKNEDVKSSKNHLRSGLPSIDSITWSDLWYETNVRPLHVYVYEYNKQIRGLISFFINDRGKFVIDAVGVDKKFKNKKIGSSLMRWAETWARSQKFQQIELWAHRNVIDWYKNYLGLKFSKPKEVLNCGKEKYTLMQRKLLYNLTDDCYFN